MGQNSQKISSSKIIDNTSINGLQLEKKDQNKSKEEKATE
jgi:hypothetical protein